MPYTHSVEALVLKTYDVGEADRLCALFTRERGRVSARATGVRRMRSRLGGMLLPFCHLSLQMKESSAGFIITGAQEWDPLFSCRFRDVAVFVQAQEGVELLLALTREEDLLPDVFDQSVSFLRGCESGKSGHVLGFALFLLSSLGFLPRGEELEAFALLSREERMFVDASINGTWNALPSLPSGSGLQCLCATLIREQTGRELRVKAVVSRW